MHVQAENPLQSLDQWDDFVKSRYVKDRKEDEFRQFTDDAPSIVKDFYKLNHTLQTLDFVRGKKAEYGPLAKRRMTVFEAIEQLNQIVDDSDPDTDLTQLDHALQTAESARADGQPRWFILSAFIHDLGKVLCLFGEPQWAVVGDTFPVGCAWSPSIVYHSYFAGNPDAAVPQYQTPFGIYSQNCGLDNVHLSWGHDEYIYLVTRNYLPESAQYMLRYHSFYPCHREGAYTHLMDAKDRDNFRWVREFNKYDLYSKGHEKPDTNAVLPFYRELVDEFLPGQLSW